MPDAIAIRRATKADLPALGRLGALAPSHALPVRSASVHGTGQPSEEGYAWFLGTQLREDDVVVFVAERESSIVGYVYAGLEPQSWKELREACGFIHDVVVDESGRRAGVATLLMEAAIEWLRERGAPRVMLWTAQQNDGAQRLFDRLGFRRTMVEMTRETLASSHALPRLVSSDVASGSV